MKRLLVDLDGFIAILARPDAMITYFLVSIDNATRKNVATVPTGERGLRTSVLVRIDFGARKVRETVDTHNGLGRLGARRKWSNFAAAGLAVFL